LPAVIVIGLSAFCRVVDGSPGKSAYVITIDRPLYGGSGTPTITSWTNDTQRGWMVRKRYADGKGPDYAYTPAGRLYQRTWARGVSTTYTTNAAGEIVSIDYSDSTPDVTYTYDRLGRRTTIVDGAGTHVLGYALDGRVLLETNTAGILAGLAITNGYDVLNRRFALGLVSDANTLVNYGYDGASRLIGVTNGVNTATYSYVANSPLVSDIEFKQGGTNRMITTKSYDYLNRLTLITNHLTGAGSENPSFAYAHNNANQRVGITNADGSRWGYTYDSLGQVTSGSKRWNDGSIVLGQQFEYTFDDIGNRKTAVSGGDANGRLKRVQNYTANNLNQYTQRTAPGYLDIIGSATNAATVTVNNQSSSRHGDYYRTELHPDNSVNPVYQSVTNVAVLAAGTNDYVTNAIGNLFIPKTPEVFGYDADGNMTNDGRWEMTWDGENRLVKIESLSTAPLASKRKVIWEFDGYGRRIRQTAYDGTDGSYVIKEDIKFVCDGWRHIAELNGTNHTRICSYGWGLDLSGSLAGAGGVGGILMLNSVANGVHFYAMDGNGNVSALAKASDGTVSANYEYGTFGQTVRSTGSMANENPFCFSTKRSPCIRDFVLYEHRAYIPRIGRWASRDPIGESAGKNIYHLTGNDPIRFIDSDGRATYDFKNDTFIKEVTFTSGDIVITPEDTITVKSGNLWPFATGTSLAKIQCLLQKLGFTVPSPKSGVYWGTFADPTANAWTLTYGVPTHATTFFKQSLMNNLNTSTVEARAVTMWHEMQGHNKNDEEDGPEFDKKYETPVIEAVARLRKQLDGCSWCTPKNGLRWAVGDAYERAMCDCEIRHSINQ
jgi:RHS repeat-associated protein